MAPTELLHDARQRIDLAGQADALAGGDTPALLARHLSPMRAVEAYSAPADGTNSAASGRAQSSTSASTRPTSSAPEPVLLANQDSRAGGESEAAGAGGGSGAAGGAAATGEDARAMYSECNLAFDIETTGAPPAPLRPARFFVRKKHPAPRACGLRARG